MASKPAANERPIVIRRVRKVSGTHHGGAWKVAYADFVTAMMAFFMLLWLISNPDKERLKGLAEYFSPAPPDTSQSAGASKDAGHSLGNGGRNRRLQAESRTVQGQPTPEPATEGSARGGTAEVPDASMRVLAQELRLALNPSSESAAAGVKIEPSREGVRISLMDSPARSMFESGTARLNPGALTLLNAVAHQIARTGTQIAIEGHTDGVGGQSDANWLLSGERALAARSALIAAGLTPDRFEEVVALGGTKPVYPDQPGRPENRRITIVLLARPSALPNDVSFKF